MRLSRVRVVFEKELLDSLRDRRTIGFALLTPLLGPLLTVTVLSIEGENRKGSVDAQLELAVGGAERAPKLIEFLRSNNVRVVAPPADPEGAVREGRLDLALMIPPEFGDELRLGHPAPLTMVVDQSRRAGLDNARRVGGLVEAYGGQIGALRLLARGVDPEVLRPLAIETIDVATPESRAALVLGMLPYFLIFAVFIGGLHVAVDTTTGERERGSLEALVANPVSRRELVLGKLAVTFAFGVLSLLETVSGFVVLPALVPAESFGMVLRVDHFALLMAFIVTLPVALLASSIQVLVATFCSSFREAQTYLSVVVMIPMIPGMFLLVVPVKAVLWMMLIPTFSEQLLIGRWLRGEPVPPLHVAAAFVMTSIVGTLVASLAMRLYQNERVVFGR